MQALCRRCGLLHQRSILLGHFVHLPDCLIDLLDAGALLLACRGNPAHEFGHQFHRSE